MLFLDTLLWKYFLLIEFNMPLRITNSTTDVASINRWAEDVESRLGATSNQSNHAVTAIKQILATPPTVSTSVTDGLIHGDTIWELDSGYTLMRDEFVGGTAVSGSIGELGWILAGTGGSVIAPRGSPFGFPGNGAFLIQNNGSVANFETITLS